MAESVLYANGTKITVTSHEDGSGRVIVQALRPGTTTDYVTVDSYRWQAANTLLRTKAALERIHSHLGPVPYQALEEHH